MNSAKNKEDSKTFLLGLGNQKCATSWLHKYLSQSANFDGGFAKEYHIWDVLDIPIIQNKLLKSMYPAHIQRMRDKMLHNNSLYFDYFDWLYKDSITVSADITPAYSGLESYRLEFIKSQFSERNIHVKAIILIRDPINRIKSAVRFNLDRQNYNEGIESGETVFSRALSQYYKSEHCRLRTSYNKIISNAYEVFGESNTYVGVYENMFESPEIEKLSQFCGVPFRHEFAKVYVNKTKNKIAQDLTLEPEIKSAYADVYEYCHDKFPVTKDLWS